MADLTHEAEESVRRTSEKRKIKKKMKKINVKKKQNGQRQEGLCSFRMTANVGNSSAPPPAKRSTTKRHSVKHEEKIRCTRDGQQKDTRKQKQRRKKRKKNAEKTTTRDKIKEREQSNDRVCRYSNLSSYQAKALQSAQHSTIRDINKTIRNERHAGVCGE